MRLLSAALTADRAAPRDVAPGRPAARHARADLGAEGMRLRASGAGVGLVRGLAESVQCRRAKLTRGDDVGTRVGRLLGAVVISRVRARGRSARAVRPRTAAVVKRFLFTCVVIRYTN